jgi:hypothetical protein
LEHPCTAHPLMSKQTWEQVYLDAWHRYYSPEHVATDHATRRSQWNKTAPNCSIH